jgi:hypothetical protein
VESGRSTAGPSGAEIGVPRDRISPFGQRLRREAGGAKSQSAGAAAETEQAPRLRFLGKVPRRGLGGSIREPRCRKIRVATNASVVRRQRLKASPTVVPCMVALNARSPFRRLISDVLSTSWEPHRFVGLPLPQLRCFASRAVETGMTLQMSSSHCPTPRASQAPRLHRQTKRHSGFWSSLTRSASRHFRPSL